MPCVCDYTSPSADQVRNSTRTRLRSIARWDFHAVEQLLSQRGLNSAQVTQAISEYRNYAHETVWSSRVPAQISKAADAALHAHILFTSNFRAFWEGSAFTHEPLENSQLRTKLPLDRIARYAAIGLGLFNGNISSAQDGCDQIITQRMAANLRKSTMQTSTDIAALATLFHSPMVKLLEYDYSWLRRALTLNTAPFQDDLRGAEKAIFELLEAFAKLVPHKSHRSIALTKSAQAALETFMLDTKEFKTFQDQMFSQPIDYDPLRATI